MTKSKQQRDLFGDINQKIDQEIASLRDNLVKCKENPSAKKLLEKGQDVLENIEVVRKEILANIQIARETMRREREVSSDIGSYDDAKYLNELKNLAKVLSCVNKSLGEFTQAQLTEEKSKENARELTHLSMRISGKASSAWKTLGKSLLVFACAVLVAAGVLAAIPTGGSSLLLSAIGGVGLAASIGIGAGIGATGVLGAGAWYHGREEGLAKSVTFFKKALDEATKAEPSPFVVNQFRENTDIGTRNLHELNRSLSNASIDGVSIQDLIREDPDLSFDPETGNLFKDERDVEVFFKKHLLKNIKEGEKDSIYKGLYSLINRGLLNQVSLAASNYFESKGVIVPCDLSGKPQSTELIFTTTPKGFKCQEIVTQKIVGRNKFDPDLDDVFRYDPGKDYVYKAQATLNIDCNGLKKQALAPEEKKASDSKRKVALDCITVENNTILYGSEEFKADIEKRLNDASSKSP